MLTGSGAECQLRTLIEILAPFTTSMIVAGLRHRCSAPQSCACTLQESSIEFLDPSGLLGRGLASAMVSWSGTHLARRSAFASRPPEAGPLPRRGPVSADTPLMDDPGSRHQPQSIFEQVCQVLDGVTP
jgi:hypothetical protein